MDGLIKKLEKVAGRIVLQQSKDLNGGIKVDNKRNMKREDLINMYKEMRNRIEVTPV